MTTTCTVQPAGDTARRMSPSLRVSRTAGFAAMSAALLAFFVAAGAPTPLLVIYEKEWHFAPSVLTIAFGVYAFALIAALLVAGSLSDYVGRRPVLIGALGLELVSMLVFVFSPSIGWIILGRILQGLATGVASSTFGAAIVELAPERRKKLGAVMSSLATTAGLGLGALFSGVIALTVPAEATSIVWVALVAVMVAATVFAILTPETSTRRPGALGSLIPRIAVPLVVRRLFMATMPTVVATFLETALFLGLGPIILSSIFGVGTPIAGGAMNFAMFTLATATAAITSGVQPRRLKVLGNAGMILGGLALLAGIATGVVVLAWISAVTAGAGMGAAFSGSIRGLVPEVRPHQRAQLLSAFFTVAYLTFGGSAIIAGFVATAVGVTPMAVGFVAVLVLVSLLGVTLSSTAIEAADHRSRRTSR